MFKAGGIPLLFIGRPEFRLLEKEAVYFVLERACRVAGSCSVGFFGE